MADTSTGLVLEIAFQRWIGEDANRADMQDVCTMVALHRH